MVVLPRGLIYTIIYVMHANHKNKSPFLGASVQTGKSHERRSSAALHCIHPVFTSRTGFDSSRRSRTTCSIVLQDLLGSLRLPSSTLPRDEDEMVVVLTAHHPVGVVSYGISG